jgi:O-antigen ligase
MRSAPFPAGVRESLLWRELSVWLAAAIVAVGIGAGVAWNAKYMVALGAATVVGAFLLQRRGNGFLLALAFALSVPYWITFGSAQLDAARVMLVVGCAGLIVGGWRTRRSLVDLAVVGLAVTEIASWTGTRAQAVPHALLIYSLIPLGLYLVARVSVGWDSADRSVRALLLFTTIGALTVLYEKFIAGHIVFADVADPASSQFNGGPGKLLRPGGIFGGAPAASIVLSMALLASLPLAVKERGNRRLVTAGAMLVILLAIVLTFSRAGWAGLIAGLVVYVWLHPWRLRWWLQSLLVLATIATIVFWALPSGATQSAGFQEAVVRSQNVTGRFNLWAATPGLVLDSPTHLVFGRGFDTFFSTAVSAEPRSGNPLWAAGGPHNDYLRALVEEGVVGLVLLLGWTLGAVVVGVRELRRLPARSPQRSVLGALTAAVVCFMIASLGHDVSQNEPSLVAAAIFTGLLMAFAKSDPPPSAVQLG